MSIQHSTRAALAFLLFAAGSAGADDAIELAIETKAAWNAQSEPTLIAAESCKQELLAGPAGDQCAAFNAQWAKLHHLARVYRAIAGGELLTLPAVENVRAQLQVAVKP
jgi:hypothetical protein